jgi:hypothetical protein
MRDRSRDDEEVIEFIRADSSGRQDELGDRYRDRQRARPPSLSPRKPNRAAADVPGFFGRKESPAVRAFNQAVDKIDWERQRNQFVLQSGLALELISVKESIGTVAAEAEIVLDLPRNSLEGIVGEQICLDSVERIRALATDVNESFRREVL